MQLPSAHQILHSDPLLPQLAHLAAATASRLYLVGGALRDILLGRAPRDLDFALADAADFARHVADRLNGAFVVLHEDFVTARVVLNPHDAGKRRQLDFAQLRGPDILSDLQARDFTVNACAWLLAAPGTESLALLDPCGGLEDLASRTIRAVARANLAADGLRCLRAFRLAGELDFTIEPATLSWIRELAPGIKHAAGERVGAELLKLLACSRAAACLRSADDAGLLEQILPEIGPARGVRQGGYHHLDVWRHSLLTVEELEKIISRPAAVLPRAAGAVSDYLSAPGVVAGLKLAALVHDLGKPATRTVDEAGRVWFRGHEQIGADIAATITRRLRLARDIRVLVERLVRLHLRPLHLVRAALHDSNCRHQPPSDALSMRAVRRLMRLAHPHGVGLVLLACADLYACRGPATSPKYRHDCTLLLDDMLVRYLQWVNEQATEPLLRGRDLIEELGLTPGPHFGIILDEVEDARADGAICNRRQALQLARQLAARLGVQSGPACGD